MRLKSLLLVMLIPALAQAADQNTTMTDASRTDTSQAYAERHAVAATAGRAVGTGVRRTGGVIRH
ncbi:Uncharacterised protein [Escherichia coli]|uniref:Uncharacterized protein n=1 Tax=Escherichia coli TaxID=562 RepID=A0A376KQJ8_ECOLX|nr:Uncharacterised protein [Escherichia coli]